jgi:hypothetical protein
MSAQVFAEGIMPAVRTRRTFGVAAICLFAFVFGIAAILVFASINTHSSSNSTSSSIVAVSCGLAFAIVGLGLSAAAIYGGRKWKAQQRLCAERPLEPWMWREDWAQGRSNSRTHSAMIQAWGFAILWNLVSAPIAFVVPGSLHRQPSAAIAFVFPIVGVGLLVWAIRETLAWFEFGVTWFEMAGSPIVVGREFHGQIHTRFPHGADHGVRLKLSCVNRVVTGSGKTQTTNEKILWRQEKLVPPEAVAPGPEGALIPVSFHIPWNALQTDGNNPRNSILWLLEADADVPGVDYKDTFELPVFRTKETPNAPEAEPAGENPASAQPSRPTILVTPTAEGTEFYFPPARNRGFAMSITAFSLLWTGVMVLIFRFHAPLIFPVVFGLFDLLLLTGAVQLWLGTSRVLVESGRVRVQAGLLGCGKWREYSKSQILDVQAVITAQQGGATGTPYYDIRLMQTEHQNVTLGRTIRDKEEAEWLVSEIKKALQMRAAAAFGGR